MPLFGGNTGRYAVYHVVTRPLRLAYRVLRFIDILLWEWAHYKNPKNQFPRTYRVTLRYMWGWAGSDE
jgi:hypothetical protein